MHLLHLPCGSSRSPGHSPARRLGAARRASRLSHQGRAPAEPEPEESESRNLSSPLSLPPPGSGWVRSKVWTLGVHKPLWRVSSNPVSLGTTSVTPPRARCDEGSSHPTAETCQSCFGTLAPGAPCRRGAPAHTLTWRRGRDQPRSCYTFFVDLCVLWINAIAHFLRLCAYSFWEVINGYNV